MSPPLIRTGSAGMTEQDIGKANACTDHPDEVAQGIVRLFQSR